jgi:radical SAM/Cys-rich protein
VDCDSQNFDSTLERHGLARLERLSVSTLQLNLGKVCNQACHHCHVDAGPKRTESMSRGTAERIISLLERTPAIRTVDITGGAPEMNPHFRFLVQQSRRLHKGVIDRCNLTILLQPGFETLAFFLAENQVEITASLPCYTESNVDAQRGRGVFGASIRALQLLNELGYGRGLSLRLNLVFNPLGPSLPPQQDSLERDYKEKLGAEFGIVFDRLFTITNMPINRFSRDLVRLGTLESYHRLLARSFNAATVPDLMCRTTVNVSWDGKLFDCDFNGMLEVPATGPKTIWKIDSFDSERMTRIATGPHCFGCTAGAGSSCGGALRTE